METVQSKLTFLNDKVIKKYNTKFRFYKKENFASEVKVLNKFGSNKYCTKVWDISENQYTMERLDFSLGNDRSLNENLRRVFFSLSLEDIMNMFDDIIFELKKSGVRHRDINPGNILYSEKERLLKLTDFAWADLVENPVDIPGAVNHIYTTDDTKAIEKIKSEIKTFYEKIKPELESAKRYFKENVGKGVHVVNRRVTGDYKDGSSIRLGWAYHPIVIPFFSDIPYHKDVCIDEYNLIKKVLPIKPKSFLDIGCSCGYQTFNLIKDFEIKYCRSFEADPAVFTFLKSVKKSFNLNELEIEPRFDDMIDLSKGYDIVIFLNSHMWVYKQIGRERTLNAVRNVINNSKWMFFQTAGDYSSSIHKVTEYKNSKDVENMLRSAGSSEVKKLDSFIGKHGAPRDLFLVKGKS